MERYCQQCICTDRNKIAKNFKTYGLEVMCNKLNKKVDAFGKEKCFKFNKNWQHLGEDKENKNEGLPWDK